MIIVWEMLSYITWNTATLYSLFYRMYTCHKINAHEETKFSKTSHFGIVSSYIDSIIVDRRSVLYTQQEFQIQVVGILVNPSIHQCIISHLTGRLNSCSSAHILSIVCETNSRVYMYVKCHSQVDLCRRKHTY